VETTCVIVFQDHVRDEDERQVVREGQIHGRDEQVLGAQDVVDEACTPVPVGESLHGLRAGQLLGLLLAIHWTRQELSVHPFHSQLHIVHLELNQFNQPNWNNSAKAPNCTLLQEDIDGALS